MKYAPIPELTDELVKRFWSKVTITANPDKCWIWNAAKNRTGYGDFGVYQKLFIASRLSYFITHKIDPKENLVLHSCDNSSCVNPNHLRLGTAKENAADRAERKRFKTLYVKGDAHPNSKLKDDDIIDILNRANNGETYVSISKIYGVGLGTISNILNGKIWSHITNINDNKYSLMIKTSEEYKARRNKIAIDGWVTRKKLLNDA